MACWVDEREMKKMKILNSDGQQFGFVHRL